MAWCGSILVGARSKGGVSFYVSHFQSLLFLLHWLVETTSIFSQKWSWSLAWKMKLVHLTRNDSAFLHQCRYLPLSIRHLPSVKAPCLVNFLYQYIAFRVIYCLSWSQHHISLSILCISFVLLTEYNIFWIIIKLWNRKHRPGH